MGIAEPENIQRFAYFVESSTRVTRTAAILVIVFVILALIAPVLLFRVIFLAFAAGPGLWLILEWRRRGRGVVLSNEHLLIEHPYTRRIKQIAYADIHAQALTNPGGLAIAYQKPIPPKPDSRTGGPVALTQMRPADDKKPRPGLVTTIRLGDPAALDAALEGHLSDRPSAVESIPPEILLQWVGRRRLRNFIVGAILFFMTPLWVIILMQILYSILKIGGVSFGR